MQSLNILLAGTPSTTVTVAEHLVSAGHNVLAVLCPFPKPVGRKQTLTPSEIEQWAVTHNINVFHTDKTQLRGDIAKGITEAPLQKLLPACDLLVVADYGYLVPAWLLNLPKFGALNIHPSLLPRWRGATPVPFTLLFGDETTGVSIIKMNEKFDLGAVVAQRVVELKKDDTTPTLLKRAFEQGAEELLSVLPAYIEGTLQPIDQPKHAPTPTTRKFTKDDGFIDWDIVQQLQQTTHAEKEVPLLKEYGLPTTAETVDQMVRALTPWPGTWTLLEDGKRMKILSVELLENGALRLKTVQYEGKTPQEYRG